MLDSAEWGGDLGRSPWALTVLLAVTTIDGFFPPVPSESVVIALAALPPASGRPGLWLLGAVAALGAFTGDQVAYSIGRRVPVRRMRIMRSERAQRAVDRAETALVERGAAFLIGARFVPAGRVAVTMAAGAMHFSRRRFSAIAALAAVLWSGYSVLLGVGAQHLLEQRHPVLGVAVGVLGGLLIGAVVDRVLRRLTRSRTSRAGPVDGSRSPVGRRTPDAAAAVTPVRAESAGGRP